MNNMPKIEEEINLIDIIRILVKRKWLIISGTLLCLVVAVAVSLVLPKVYKVSFVADIGMVQRGDGMEPIESPENVKSKIEMGYSFAAMQALNIPEDEFPDILVKIPKKTRLIEMAVKTDDTEEGQSILQHIKGMLLEEHGKLLDQYRVKLENAIKGIALRKAAVYDAKKVLEKKLKILQSSKKDTREQMNEVGKRIEDLWKEKKKINLKANPDNTLSLLVFTNEVQANQRYYNQLQDKLNVSLANQEVTLNNNLQNNERERQKLELERLKYESQLNALQETTIIKEPSFSEKPVSPKKRLIVALAGVIGLMASIFLAFFMEFVEKYRLEQPESRG